MLSKQQVSYLRSLHQKKFRQMYGKFLVEGDKLVHELLESNFKIDAVYSTSEFEIRNSKLKGHHFIVSEPELQRISTHQNPNMVVAVASIPKVSSEIGNLKSELELVVICDGISDPGNAGTIIRSAEWFGANAVVFSKNSVDIFNPKVVNAAKGSLFRMPCIYANLPELLAGNKETNVYGTFMQGENIYNLSLSEKAYIVIGNEANGISKEVTPFINTKITIPSASRAESLNAGVATAVVLSEFARRKTL